MENLTLYAKWAQFFTIDNMTYVYYGTYPQTVVDDSALISSLNTLLQQTQVDILNLKEKNIRKWLQLHTDLDISL